MNKIKSLSKASLVGVLAGVSAGCSTAPMKEAVTSHQNMKKKAEELASSYSTLSASPVSARFVDEYYIVGNRFDVESRRSLPSFFRDSYSFNRIDPITFSELMSYINKVTNTRVVIASDAAEHLEYLSGNKDDEDEDDIDLGVEGDATTADLNVDIADLMSDYKSGLTGSSLLFNVSFEGTLEDFLNHITGRVDLSWDWKGDHIEIYHVKEKTFVIDSDLSDITFSALMAGGSGSVQEFAMQNEMGSLYDEIHSVISNTISGSGKFSVSKQLSTITVLDTPMHLKRVERYVKSINAIASKQIMMKVQVMNIESDKSGDYGIDWESLFGNSSRVSGGISTSFLGDQDGVFDVSLLDGAFSGTAAMVNSLMKMSNVSSSVNTTIHTSNGRPVPLSIGNDKAYVQSITREAPSVEGESPLYTPEQDIMRTGFMINILPRVNSNGDISMTMALDISDGVVENKIFNDGSEIGLPDKTHRSFIQRAVSKNGVPVMLAGFERESSESKDSRLGDNISWLVGGRQEASNKKTITVVLITPYVVK